MARGARTCFVEYLFLWREHPGKTDATTRKQDDDQQEGKEELRTELYQNATERKTQGVAKIASGHRWSYPAKKRMHNDLPPCISVEIIAERPGLRPNTADAANSRHVRTSKDKLLETRSANTQNKCTSYIFIGCTTRAHPYRAKAHMLVEATAVVNNPNEAAETQESLRQKKRKENGH